MVAHLRPLSSPSPSWRYLRTAVVPQLSHRVLGCGSRPAPPRQASLRRQAVLAGWATCGKLKRMEEHASHVCAVGDTQLVLLGTRGLQEPHVL